MATDTWSGASSRRIKPVRARYSTLFRRRVGTAGARSTAQKFQTVHDTSRIAVEGAFLYGLLSRPRRTHSGDDWLDSRTPSPLTFRFAVMLALVFAHSVRRRFRRSRITGPVQS